MNFYNTLSNLPDDWDYEDGTDYAEAVANYHFAKAREAIDTIKERDPILARAVADAVLHGLMAANAYNHDMFAPMDAEGEDMATRIRKNR